MADSNICCDLSRSRLNYTSVAVRVRIKDILTAVELTLALVLVDSTTDIEEPSVPFATTLVNNAEGIVPEETGISLVTASVVVATRLLAVVVIVK